MGFTSRKRGPKGQMVQTPKAEIIVPIDMDEDFSDVSGAPGNHFRLENPDPSRHYIWAHNDAADIQSYQAEIVPYRLEFYGGDKAPDAVRPRGCIGILEEGDRIVVQDHCLLSCDRARYEKRARYRIVEGRKQYLSQRQNRNRSTELDMKNPGRVAAEMQGLDRYASQMPQEQGAR